MFLKNTLNLLLHFVFQSRKLFYCKYSAELILAVLILVSEIAKLDLD